MFQPGASFLRTLKLSVINHRLSLNPVSSVYCRHDCCRFSQLTSVVSDL